MLLKASVIGRMVLVAKFSFFPLTRTILVLVHYCSALTKESLDHLQRSPDLPEYQVINSLFY